jgi:hypothetical protein
MSRFAQGKRQHLILVGLGAVIAMVTLFYLLVDGPRTKLKAKLTAFEKTKRDLGAAHKQISEAGKVKAGIDRAERALQTMEAKMAAGDPYRWVVKAFLDFAPATNVVMANIEPPHVTETLLLPKVPYKTATFTVAGTAYFHEFGTFLAELENEFPHMRIKRVDLSPAYPGEADSPEAEKLNFQVEIAMLFKASTAQPGQLSLGPASEKGN